MAEQAITCPHCGKRIPLSKALAGQIEERLRKDFENRIKNREKAVKDEYERKLATEISKLEKQAKKSAEEAIAVELDDLREQMKERDRQIEEARKEELKLRKRQRTLEQKESEMELNIARKIDEERQKIRSETAAKLAEEHHTKDLEKDKQLGDLRRQIEELKRKAEQGSQQTQGEVVELELEDVLAANFRCDQIEPVAKGIRGADVLQKVYSQAGQHCGTIVWESKNTKAWSDGWLTKLKDDQRAMKAELAALVSAVLPNNIAHFALIDGVWVMDLSSVIGVATALRANLIEVAMTKLATVGKNEKMEMLYGYLSGMEFKQRVEAIVESFISMKEDLDQERRTTEKIWSKREKQIQRVVQNVAGMYGDMQGIIGGTLAKIERLELPAMTDIPEEEL